MEPTEENIRAWNELQRRRVGRLSAPALLAPEVRALLPDLTGKHVLHLHCGTGEATAELVELGGLVTGIDVEEDVLAEARERVPNALFLRAELDELPSHLRRHRSDLVYGGLGILAAVTDLTRWLGEVVATLRDGGQLVVHDAHPVAGCVDPLTLRWRADYFELIGQVGELVTAVVESGLSVTTLAELKPSRSLPLKDPRVPGELILIAARP